MLQRRVDVLGLKPRPERSPLPVGGEKGGHRL